MTSSIPQAQPPPESPRLRLWRWRRNPLLRPVDRLQGWIGLCLLAAVAAAAPAAMCAAGETAHRHYERIAQHQARVRHHIPAVLVHDVPRHPEPGSAEARETLYPAEVRFTDPAGHTRTAETAVAPGLSANSTVPIWADADGTPTDPPLDADRIRSHSVGWAALAGIAVVASGAAAYRLAGVVLLRRNLEAWGRAWADTGPRWTTSV
ncbi:Rv1733c family protein, partial [Streptomyces wuyuanensis]|uniref:Rv1733c family protein n=1 Tax=Streptomyces wuyuanensis TaxID=1196353 RepID=UPI003D70E8D1